MTRPVLLLTSRIRKHNPAAAQTAIRAQIEAARADGDLADESENGELGGQVPEMLREQQDDCELPVDVFDMEKVLEKTPLVKADNAFFETMNSEYYFLFLFFSVCGTGGKNSFVRSCMHDVVKKCKCCSCRQAGRPASSVTR